MDFQYKVTVIVPVYNVEQYLRDCLDSLVAQTMDHTQMEVLLINDGSTDNSLDICYEYAQSYFMFKVFSKENEGLSATRNYGIERAKGKYMMYLDSDDMLAPETVKAVTDFFDTVYDEVDLVTYLDQPYKNGEKMKIHHRYKYLKEQGVYSLDEFPFITQTRVNICVKNEEQNYLFDTTPNFRLEDQEYCSKVLKAKRKIGFCAKGEYQYNRSNESSIVANYFQAYYLFEPSISYFESLFNSFNGPIPKYYQVMFFHDISWKLKENILFPYHYDKEQFQKAVERISKLLDKVDDDIIMTNPSTDNFHRHFFMNLKSDSNKVTVISENDSICIYKNGNLLYKNSKMEIILNTLNVFGKTLSISAHLKSPIFNYIEAPDIIAVLTDANGNVTTQKMELHLSSDSYYHTKEKTNNFYGFLFTCNIKDVSSVEFKVKINGIYYNCYYYFMSSAPYSSGKNKYSAIFNNCVVRFRNNVFYIYAENQYQIKNERVQANGSFKNNNEALQIRTLADEIRTKRIWLYYDCQGVEKDNGYYQFCHDFNKSDGIERYYINTNDDEINYTLFTDEQKQNIVNFGSEKHKILYLAAEKIITAYVEDRNVIPFKPEEQYIYCDVAHAQIIYLQHGILHAHLPWKYSPGRVHCDKVVISSYFERDNFSKTYNFPLDSLIESGMPRFDHINKKAKPSNRILFAPSWRNYLIGQADGNRWVLTEGKFLTSDYYIFFNQFLNSPELEEVLSKNDLYLDFKIHPIFAPYLHSFENKNEHVKLAPPSVNDEDYAAFITDFSSFVFDFAYIKRPIMYFVPDMPQFKSGMNQYRELDLPFEKAFGNLTTTPDEAVKELIRIIDNKFIPDPVYQKRMDEFFLPLDNCEEKLYDYLMKN